MTAAREDIAGYSVFADDIPACVSDVMQWIASAPPRASCRWLACLNPHSYVVSRGDPQFSAALGGADWLVPDGVGVVLASRIRGGRIRQRVTGSDVFHGLSRMMDRESRYSVFFLGSTEGVLASIRARMARDYPGIRVAGTYSPPFKPEFTDDEIDRMVAAVNCAAPDVLWVGMTAPKQEKWIHRSRDRLSVKFTAAIGAVFDFYSGNMARSLPAFRRVGLEWLPRLAQEPRRLWKRTFVSAPIFLWHVLRADRRSLPSTGEHAVPSGKAASQRD